MITREGHSECRHATSVVVYRRMQERLRYTSPDGRSTQPDRSNLGVALLGFMLLLFTSSSAFAQDDLLMDIRKNIGEVFKTEAVCLRFHDLFEKTDISKSNLLLGYKGAVELGMARHDANVFKKMSWFGDGKENLEKSIKNDPQNIELRFLRLTIQTHLPAFLGYSDSKEKDKTFVLTNLEKAPSEEFKTRVRGFIKHAEEEGKL